MFKNYFKTAYRNLRRHKGYAALNVAGLSVGIAASLLLFLLIRYETGFDNFHARKDRIYRVVMEKHGENGLSYSSGIPFPMPDGIRAELPQLEKVAGVYDDGKDVVSTAPDAAHTVGQKFAAKHIFYAETAFFEIFSFAWLSGNHDALSTPGHALLSKTIAEKFFGDWHNAVGKTINVGHGDVYQVAGVLADPPANTDFPFSIVLPFVSLQTPMKDDWVGDLTSMNGYVVLPPGMSVATVNAQLKAFVKKHKPADAQGDQEILQPLTDIHFNSRFGNYNDHTASRSLLFALGLVGIFLLLIACVNFINLATAQAVNRSKEVGVRKALGSGRGELVAQFLTETGLITFVAVLIALVLAALALPFLNNILKTPLHLTLASPALWLFLGATFVGVVLLSGLYPTFMVARFNAVAALKSKLQARQVGGIGVRRALVIFQFVIAQVLIIGMLVVVSQMNFFRKADLGFNKEAIVQVSLRTDSLHLAQADMLRNEFLKVPGVKEVSFGFAAPTDMGSWNSYFSFNGQSRSPSDLTLRFADSNYFHLFQLRFAAGRAYTPHAAGLKEFVVNETFVKKEGFTNPGSVLGKPMTLGSSAKGIIVGVVKDFHINSLRDPIIPLLITSKPAFHNNAYLKIDPNQLSTALAGIRRQWEAAFQEDLYDYNFLDKNIAAMYEEENQLSQLYQLFAGIAIFISCLGLYGLVSFIAVQRNKEVGIRKVLGASVAQIVYLFSKEFMILIGIAFLIAAPIAYYFMQQWLQHFTYSIHLGPGIFAIAILVSALIAGLSVGYQSVKAALMNPVKTLRSE